jgi:hypothetical protein
MSIVEMGNVSTINIVGTANVITVKTLKHVRKNAKNVVGMGSVVPWKPVRIVEVIVDPVLQIHTVGTLCVMVLKLVILVLGIVEDAIQIVGMVRARIRLGKPARLVLTIADPALPLIHIVGTWCVMEMKAA